MINSDIKFDEIDYMEWKLTSSLSYSSKYLNIKIKIILLTHLNFSSLNINNKKWIPYIGNYSAIKMMGISLRNHNKYHSKIKIHSEILVKALKLWHSNTQFTPFFSLFILKYPIIYVLLYPIYMVYNFNHFSVWSSCPILTEHILELLNTI